MTTMEPKASLACGARCGFEAAWDAPDLRCPRCGDLLEIRHELEPLRQRSGAQWREDFDRRMAAGRLPLASGVWGKREWVLPALPDASIVSLGEGRTPLMPLERMGERLGLSELWLKQCGVSPTGSFKDLGMTVLVSAVRHIRDSGARPIRAVACASTGDTSAALAAYAGAAGLPAVVLLPRDKVTVAQLVQPLAHGAHVLSLDTDFDGCMRLIRTLAEEDGLYLANSMNPLRLEGQKTVGIELCQQLDWEVPDWIVLPGGNLGNVSALAAGLDLMVELGVVSKRPRIAVAQARAANPLVRALREGREVIEALEAGHTWASAIRIGDPVSARRAMRALKRFEGVAEDASEVELSDAAAEADREGAFACPHTGVALAALEKLVAQGTIEKGSRVAVVSTAHGLKFSDFKVAYHRGEIERGAHATPNPPVEVGANLDAIRRVLDARLAPHDRALGGGP